MGGKLLTWRWGLSQSNTVKKERKSSVNKSGKFRKVRFLDTSGDKGGSSGGGGVVNDKEQKRVWFSRLWFSIRRKQNKKKGSATDTNGISNPATSSALADIQCKLRNFRRRLQRSFYGITKILRSFIYEAEVHYNDILSHHLILKRNLINFERHTVR